MSKQFRDRVEGDGPENGNSNDIAMAGSRTRKQVRINLIDPSGKVTEGRIDYSVEGTESENVRSKKNTSCVHYFYEIQALLDLILTTMSKVAGGA